MAKRKDLKKSINLICGELFADCIALSMCGQGNNEAISQLMTEIIEVRADFISRISHTEKGSERLFYKKLREEFTEKANSLSDRIIKA